MLYNKQKKNQNSKGIRFLITITVLGSAGPIRFVVNEEELVADVIETALKCYAREGRLPILGSCRKDFVLYCPHAASEALNPWATIGSSGARNFMLCKRPESQNLGDDGGKPNTNSASSPSRKASGSWKAWLNKSLGLIPSH